MKFKVEVDLSEFVLSDFDQDDMTFEEAIIDRVANEVQQRLFVEFREKFSKEYYRTLMDSIEKERDQKIEEIVDGIFEEKKLRNGTQSIKEFFYESLEKRLFTDDRISSKFAEINSHLNKQIGYKIDDVSKKIIARYDMNLAKEIVQKLDNRGLLAENVARLVL